MTGWLVEALAASALLMIAVLVVRRPVAARFGPHAAYALWLLPALRLVLPPLPAELTLWPALAPAPLATALPGALPVELVFVAVPEAAQPLDNGPGTAGTLLAVWALGALIFLAVHLWRYRSFLAAMRRMGVELPRLDHGGIEVWASAAAPGPFAAGIFAKSIVLPIDWRQRFTPAELHLALAHEAAHHRRHDMSANLAALAVLALHWWNPIAHYAYRAFRLDQELACDAAVLAGAGPDMRVAYGRAMLKSARGRLPAAACGLGAGDDLKRRLKMMATYRPDARRARIGTLVVALAVGGGLALTASGGLAAETGSTVERRVQTALLAPPAPPAPPAAEGTTPVPRAPAPRWTADTGVAVAAAPPAPQPPAVPEAPAAGAAPPAPPAPPVPPREVLSFLRQNGQTTVAIIGDPAFMSGAAMPRIQIRMAGLGDCARPATEARDAQSGDAKAGDAKANSGEVRKRCFVLRSDLGDRVRAAETRVAVLAALEQARTALAARDDEDWGRRARAEALQSIDQQIARLKAGK
ncbi:hypothetical protein GVO57_11415 [Sphingomonas changnyeongensis]|uniref:Peptidase M56 domain-containing protein n=1 Tax=Sphingomonas changnyeongensis TaxID=2698679 RepID=A0A7Z2NX13_9SPHN|nr:M56 family metallopeptidase [Sphingomonas changnyeongensis]QHL91312.1 hypothetical protein GVO57_11415 [Sphingomonas changnyeongensis]